MGMWISYGGGIANVKVMYLKYSTTIWNINVKKSFIKVCQMCRKGLWKYSQSFAILLEMMDWIVVNMVLQFAKVTFFCKGDWFCSSPLVTEDSTVLRMKYFIFSKKPIFSLGTGCTIVLSMKCVVKLQSRHERMSKVLKISYKNYKMKVKNF